MAQIRLVRTLPATRPQVAGVDYCRAARGYTAQAAAAPKNRRSCRFCGELHRARRCSAPIRRGWGWPGWENGTEERTALMLSGSPRSAKQMRIATFVASRSSTAVYSPASTAPIPRPRFTSFGTPAKPQ